MSASTADVVQQQQQQQQQEIFTYDAPWPVFASAWSTRPDRPFRLAVGSFIEEYSNRVRLVQLQPASSDGGVGAFELNFFFFFFCCWLNFFFFFFLSTASFSVRGEFEHPYPATKVQFIPDASGVHSDLLATSGDYLRLWSIDDANRRVSLQLKLDNNQKSEFCAPLTAFDWNETAANIIGTASIDTTCTIWDLNTQVATTQLIAHDKEVYDIAFARGTDVFASVGADGSLRLFDLRSLEHSTILYEHSQPLLRLAWNKQDPNYLITFAQESNSCIVLDVRVPSIPCAELRAHAGPINAAAWAPHSSCHLCTAGDDGRAFIWDLAPLPNKIVDPMLGFSAVGPINQLQWSALQTEWISVAFESQLQVLRV